jgi:hypothetical protein
MRGRGIILSCIFVWIASAAVACGEETRAEKIIGRYLKMSFEEEGRPGESAVARRTVLEQLKTMPDEAVPALARTIADAKNKQQRRELTGVLSDYFKTKRVADLLVDLLKDPDEQVRRKAIHGLRMMARRTDRSGGRRISHGPEFEPAVEGLVPSLIAAADDTSEMNRVTTMYALADTRDPAAVAELRRRLDDSSQRVRLVAACLLTEYADASGLPVMRKALERLRKAKANEDISFYWDAEMLLASFERITGKGFGEIAMNPTYSSDSRQVPRIEQQYQSLLEAWAKWWAWQPDAKPE